MSHSTEQVQTHQRGEDESAKKMMIMRSFLFSNEKVLYADHFIRLILG